jgi:hypothetical protein
MDNDKHPLIDVGLIEVALAITAVGFVIKEAGDVSSPALANTGGAVFFLGGAASLLLYTTYVWEWVERNFQRYRRGAMFARFVMALLAHILLFLLLFSLVVVLGRLVPPPAGYR